MILNIKIIESLSESAGEMYTLIDLVGFDEEFTSKIMEGSSF